MNTSNSKNKPDAGLPLVRIAFWNAVLFWGIPGVQTFLIPFYKERCHAGLAGANLFILALVVIPLWAKWKLSGTLAIPRKKAGLFVGIILLFCVHAVFTAWWVFHSWAFYCKER